MEHIKTLEEIIKDSQKDTNTVILDYGKYKLFYAILFKNNLLMCTFEEIGKYLLFTNFIIEKCKINDVEKLEYVQKNYVNAKIPTNYEVETILRKLQKHLIKSRMKNRFETNKLINQYLNKGVENGK